ncbi:dienelactone hydrolase family protein [Azospirillum doebereinerae]|uniref:dienelactone hydrolase family protein n=1 Tax=Azospirillum doebereinerae TaxID=92933 RepID=UPI001EE5AF2F|nr:dienelactone hydrolase family protein [Azospirillum doebereinerae]MCG5240159.1 dienelactone hydrolase family protein [Azospirillum doebereinerae]
MMASTLRRVAVLGMAAWALAAYATPEAAHAASGVHAEEIVRFPSLDGDLNGGTPTRLTGRLLRPAGTGPHPSVVLLHGCGGLYAKTGRVAPRHVWWATTLQQQGYEVLMVDSFGPRGVSDLCTAKERPVRASVERKRDAWAALAYLRNRPEVDHGRIALMGWSQGAGTVLAAYGAGEDGQAGGESGGFRAAIAFYPGCKTPLSDEDWQPDGPLLMLVGEKDDWNPPDSCVDLVKRDAVKERTELVVYPNAYHGFDAPDVPVRKRQDLATAPGGAAHFGTNEDARKDAIERVTNFLNERLRAGG